MLGNTSCPAVVQFDSTSHLSTQWLWCLAECQFDLPGVIHWEQSRLPQVAISQPASRSALINDACGLGLYDTLPDTALYPSPPAAQQPTHTNTHFHITSTLELSLYGRIKHYSSLLHISLTRMCKHELWLVAISGRSLMMMYVYFMLFFLSLFSVNWLDHSKTLREQGVEFNETLLLRRKFFFSDQNVDARDPVQLNLLYVQVRYPSI